MNKESKIKHFPISFFSIILGMAGFTTAIQKAEQLLFSNLDISTPLLIFTTSLFIIISFIYLIKIIRFRNDVKKEFDHPVKLNFFPAFSISLLLLSVAFLSVDLAVSKYLWIFGTIIHILFTIRIISIWIQHTKFDIKHMNPAWFIPTVGNMIIPIAGVSHYTSEVSWFFFSVGFFLWVTLFVIFFNRIIFHHPLPSKLLPTLFILIAPPAVGFVSLVKLTGEVNEFSQMLYYFGLFILILLLAQINLFRKIKFFLSWWAYSFPIAAITIATLLMYHESNIMFFKYLAYLLVSILIIVISILLTKTVTAIYKKEICVEEEE
jgi:tellurite resistance protein